MTTPLESLFLKEGWEIKGKGIDAYVEAFGQSFNLFTEQGPIHPFSIYAKLYRTETNPDLKYNHMKAMHDILWPNLVYHYWTEERFRAHCEGWNCISWAGGGGTAKSFVAAQIAILFQFANPKHRSVVVASTTLDGLDTRVWGYITSLLRKATLPFNYEVVGKPPKILMPSEGKKGKDTIHGMFAVSARAGDSSDTIKNWIGKHPDEALLVIIDEAPDMPVAVVDAIPNLSLSVEHFQLIAIGNSKSKIDLHGALSTPKEGWGSVNPSIKKWETTQENGCCLFFDCYDNPSLFEADPIKKAKLEKIFLTLDKIESKKKILGENSDSFWRMIRGFWRDEASDETVVNRKFIEEFDVFSSTEWSPFRPLNIAAGLDVAFSTGGDSVILQLAYVGMDIHGQIVLDYKNTELCFKIPIEINKAKAPEIQISDYTLLILDRYKIPLSVLCVDATGQGRAVGEVIRLRLVELLSDPVKQIQELGARLTFFTMQEALKSPTKIYSAGTASVKKAKESFDVVIKSQHEMWFTFRNYIQSKQIRGLSAATAQQLTSRMVILKAGRQNLESKVEYKSRMRAINPTLAHSPDEADACALTLQSAILNFGFLPGDKQELPKSKSLDEEKFDKYKLEQLVKQQIIDSINNSAAKYNGMYMKAPPSPKFSGSLESYVKHRSSPVRK